MPKKRVGDKRMGSILRKKADDAWLDFLLGFKFDFPTKIFESMDEARQAWELVRDKYLQIDPLTDPNSYGPEAWWLFDCPGAPFVYEDIEGLDFSHARTFQKRQALIAWGILEENAPNPVAECIKDFNSWLLYRPSEWEKYNYPAVRKRWAELGLIAESEST